MYSISSSDIDETWYKLVEMIEVSACLPRGSVYLAGETVKSQITFSNTSQNPRFVVYILYMFSYRWFICFTGFSL